VGKIDRADICSAKADIMKTRNRWFSGLVLLAGFTFMLQISTGASAQDNQQDNQDVQNQDAQNQDVQNQDTQNNDNPNTSDDQDPPGRVARLNFS
jgi:hypothetical protein